MHYAFPHLHLAETGSTNEVALELLSKTNPEPGFMVISDFQTAGKGQYGRTWQSEPGKNLLASYIFGPLDWSMDNLFDLHLYSIPAIHGILNEMGIPSLRIKWPNDLMAGSRKMGGILIQNLLREAHVQWTVIGIGINVNQTYFPEGLSATSILHETGKEISIIELASKIRNTLVDCFLHKQDSSLLLEVYNTFLYARDTKQWFMREDGSCFEGVLRYVDAKGALYIEHDPGELNSYTFGSIRQKV